MAHKTAYRFAVPILMACVLSGALFCLPDGARSAPENPRESKACLECHDGKDASLAATPHSVTAPAAEGTEVKTACTDCHTGDRRHWEEDAEKYPMPVPSSLDAAAQARACAACHQTAHQMNMLEKNLHLTAKVACSACHSVHGSTLSGLLRKPEPGLCLGCHSSVEGQFAKSYRHPVMQGVMKCTECHMTLSETKTDLSRNGTNMCVKCHGEFSGPFPYEHQAALDYTTEEGGCLSCHEAHGGHLPRMVQQPYEGPHYQLCTQCHSVPGHNQNPMHGTQWAGMACNECHVDIHGSYSNRLFVNESLQAQGCFNSGCHQL